MDTPDVHQVNLAPNESKPPQRVGIPTALGVTGASASVQQ
jgi:hypothetical protein